MAFIIVSCIVFSNLAFLVTGYNTITTFVSVKTYLDHNRDLEFELECLSEESFFEQPRDFSMEWNLRLGDLDVDLDLEP